MPMFLLNVGVIMGGDTKIIYSEEMRSLESQDKKNFLQRIIGVPWISYL